MFGVKVRSNPTPATWCGVRCGVELEKTDGLGCLVRRKPQRCSFASRGFATTPGDPRRGFMFHIASNTAPAGQTWQRRSTLGLQGGFSEVRLGREKNASGLTWKQPDPFSDIGVTAIGRLNQAFTATSSSYPRSSNIVSCYTPNLGGSFCRTERGRGRRRCRQQASWRARGRHRRPAAGRSVLRHDRIEQHAGFQARHVRRHSRPPRW